MMTKPCSSRRAMVLALLLALPAPPSAAESVRDMIKILESEGFVVTDIGHTILGRVRIEAVTDGYLREVILSRSTGEIRQDAIFRHRSGAAGVGTGPADDTSTLGAGRATRVQN